MSYISLNPTTHLIVESQDRQKVDLESVYTSGGSFYESADHRGRKHLLEHCLVARTKSMDFEAFKDYQFAQNVTVNAATSPRYMWLEMSGHTSNWQEMLEILCEMTYLPTFDQSILDQEREIVLREISERRGEPGYILYYDTMKAVFSKDSVATHETLGSSEQVAKTKLSDFAELHQQSLQDSHVVYTLSGGFDPQEAQKTIQTYLETHPEIIPPLSETPPRRPKSTLNTFRYLPFVHPLAHEHVELNLLIPTPINSDNIAVWQIFKELYLKFHGVIYDTLRNKKGLIYSMNASVIEDIQRLEITISCEIRHAQTIVETIKELLSNFETSFKEQKFHELKDVLVKKNLIASDNPNTLAMFTQDNLLLYNKPISYSEIIQAIKETTVDDLKAFYNQITRTLEDMQIYAVSKKREIESLKLA